MTGAWQRGKQKGQRKRWPSCYSVRRSGILIVPEYEREANLNPVGGDRPELHQSSTGVYTSFSKDCNFVLPRLMRLLTVPIGNPVISAISS